MTAAERAELRLRISEVRHQQLALDLAAASVCAYHRCGRAFEPRKGKRFCCSAHRTAAYQRTDRGREIYNRWRRKRDKQLRAERRLAAA